MAPEQALGRIDELEARTDIYALGAILYNMLCLRPPVEGKTVHEILRKVSNGQISPPTALSAHVSGNGTETWNLTPHSPIAPPAAYRRHSPRSR